ncbi:MAG TPA: sterol desaturase family protein [Candidatus Angelobacter sp.]|nr:sterol desaturase family protein [Candidatus Angelobacter sp.]
MSGIDHFLSAAAQQLAGPFWTAIGTLVWPALVFGALAALTKGRAALAWTAGLISETRINLSLHFVDWVLAGPLMGIVLAAINGIIGGLGFRLVGAEAWAGLGSYATVATAVLAGDFADYWSHRLMHSRHLWPTHAVHHSDTEVSWLTVSRIHPISRLITQSFGVILLSVFGFPLWAIVAAGSLRYFYGLLIHADVPWTFGPLAGIFVSPAMHRWHHAREIHGAGSNYAFVFAVFDRAFGTYYLPGPCDAPLGVDEKIGGGAVGMLWHPFRKMAAPLMVAQSTEP